MTTGRLLILDDDEMVGQLLKMASRGAGFDARWCAQPEPFFQALDAWAPTHVALDLVMPDITAHEVMRGLAQRGCRARVIVTSGLGAPELQAALDEAERYGLAVGGVLPKPFSLATVRALLSR